MNFGSIIAEAILEGTDAAEQTAIARACVKMAVMRECVCRCGSILDQSRAVLMESEVGRSVAVICSNCFDNKLIPGLDERDKREWFDNEFIVSDGRTLFGEE